MLLRLRFLSLFIAILVMGILCNAGISQGVELFFEATYPVEERDDLVEVVLFVDAGVQKIDAVETHMHFNSDNFSVAELGAFSELPIQLESTLDKEGGVIHLAFGTLDNFPKGKIPVAKITFMILGRENLLELDFIEEENLRPIVTYRGKSVLDKTTPLKFRL